MQTNRLVGLLAALLDESRQSRGWMLEARPVQTKPKTADSLDPEAPPFWWEPQAAEDWRREVWPKFPLEYRAVLVRQWLGPPFALRRPDDADATILWEQYHFLKALAVRLDAGRGREQDRVMFEAGLREYNANYDRVLAHRKALPG